MINRYECPLSTCDWHHDEPTPYATTSTSLFTTDTATLAECGGDLISASALTAARADATRIAAILHEHCHSHPIEDYLCEIQALRSIPPRPGSST